MKTMTIGDRIREARGEHLTQDGLAERIRAKHPTSKLNGIRISRYERDVQTPRMSVLVQIAEATDKPLEFFRVDVEAVEQAETDDEDESEAVLLAAHKLELLGDYSLADALRSQVRSAKFRAARKSVAA